MGFNKRYLPEVEKLQKIHKKAESDIAFLLGIIGKSDALIGDKESMDYIKAVQAKVEKENK